MSGRGAVIPASAVLKDSEPFRSAHHPQTCRL